MSIFVKVDMCKSDVFALSRGESLSFIDRESTALESMKLFMGWLSVDGIKMKKGLVAMIGVGLTCAGRGGCYIVVFNPEEMVIYTIDMNDSNYVCRVPIKV